MPLAFFGESQSVPYYIRVEAVGTDITEKLDFENDIFPKLPAESSWPVKATAADQEQTAAHAARPPANRPKSIPKWVPKKHPKLPKRRPILVPILGRIFVGFGLPGGHPK